MSEGPSHNQLLFHHQQQQPQASQQVQTHSRYGRGLRSAPGEIVKVQGGHIVRSTGRKDRHSKVCTAKGPRDRRVRLSANTAIQFYDVQDRLGYDRPSKAVDWLMKNAKAAIDDLAELPPWHPTAVPNPTISSQQNSQEAAAVPAANVHGYGGGDGGGGSFLPPSLDSDAIADTIKSFFPMGTAASSTTASSSSPIGFQNYPPDFLSRASSHNQPPDFLSRTSSHNQDLRLSLHSFQDTIYQHHPNAPHHHQQQQQNSGANIFAGFDTAAMVNPWNNIPESSSGGYVFNVPSLGQSQFFTTQRGPLQSSNQPFVRAWVDPIANNAAAAGVDSVVQQPSVQSFGFASGSGFAGFRIPAWIQGEEEHDGVPDKPSSASSGSHH